MSVQLCIYEDERSSRFFPLIWTRPVYDLTCGITTLREKILRAYPGTNVCLACRDYLRDVMREQYSGVEINTISEEKVLFINGRVLAEPDLATKIPLEGEDTVYVSGDDVVAVRLGGEGLAKLKKKLPQLLRRSDFEVSREESVDVALVGYIWELVSRNGDQIGADYRMGEGSGGVVGKVYDGVHLLNPSLITVRESAVVKPGVVLDAEMGPVLIDEEAEVLPHAVIQGPVYIGKRSLIKIGAKIYGGTSVGEMCKVGGEVEETIIHGYSNKQHDGFLGHSYIGMWVNLGAGTNNSDLRNDYENVKVFVSGETIDSGETFVGLTMSDHSKTGINTMFNTGSVVGVSCNVFGFGFLPTFIPSFSWGRSRHGRFLEYDLSKSIKTARRVMHRREVEMGKSYEKMLRDVYEKTAEYRRPFCKQD